MANRQDKADSLAMHRSKGVLLLAMSGLRDCVKLSCTDTWVSSLVLQLDALLACRDSRTFTMSYSLLLDT